MRTLLIQDPEWSSKQSNSIYAGWDYSCWRVTLVITASLASCVLPLSTRRLSAILVPLSDAFLRVWQLTRRNMLFVHLSSACLASSSVPLRTYVFFPNNYLSLASLSKPNSLSCRVLITFHILPEQSLRFNCLCLCLKQVRLPFRQHPISFMVGCEGLEPPKFWNLLRCAAPVASHLVRNEIQHTNCFSACGLLDGFSSVRVLTLQLSNWYHAFSCEIRLCTYLLAFSIH